VSWPASLSGALSGTPFGIDERAEVVKPVCGHQTSSHKLPQAGFNFRFELCSAPNDVGEERSSAIAKKFHDLASARAQPLDAMFSLCMSMMNAGKGHPFCIVPDKEGYRRDAGGNDATRA